MLFCCRFLNKHEIKQFDSLQGEITQRCLFLKLKFGVLKWILHEEMESLFKGRFYGKFTNYKDVINDMNTKTFLKSS